MERERCTKQGVHSKKVVTLDMDFAELERRVVSKLLKRGPVHTKLKVLSPEESELLFGLRYGKPLSPLSKSITGRYENV